jgi:hypothetical protein
MPQERRYESPVRREETRPNGKTSASWMPGPTWCYHHWRRSYAREKGQRRGEVVGYFAAGFDLDGDVAERILRDDTPHRTEPDGTFVMTLPD